MNQRRLTFVLMGLLVLLCLVGLGFRPRFDDWWFATRTDLYGVTHDGLGFMQSIVNTLHGRFSTLVVQTSISAFEPLATMLYPAFLMVTLTLLLMACLREAGYPRLTYLVPLWVAAGVMAQPQLFSAIYLLNVAVVYDTPIIVTAFAALLMLKRRAPLWCLPLGAIAGGFSECNAIILAGLPLVHLRRFRRGLLWWWMGLGIALAFMLFTPGVQLRAQGVGAASLDALSWRLLTGWLLHPDYWLGSPAGYALVFFAGLVFPHKVSGRALRNGWLVVVAAYLVVFLTVIRGNGVASSWTLALPAALSLPAVWATGCYLSRPDWQGWARWGLVASVVLAYGLVIELLIGRAGFALQWQARDNAIRAGERHVSEIAPGTWVDSLTPQYPFWRQNYEQWLGVALHVEGYDDLPCRVNNANKCIDTGEYVGD